MSYGLVTRALNAPIGVTSQNRFGLTRSYIPLSQYFLQKGGDSEKETQGKALYGLSEPSKLKAGKKPRKPKAGKSQTVSPCDGSFDAVINVDHLDQGGKGRDEGAFWAIPALPVELELLDEAELKWKRGTMMVPVGREVIPKETKGYVKGVWGVHRIYVEHFGGLNLGNSWTIVHIPSMWRIYPSKSWALPKAKAIVDAFLARNPEAIDVQDQARAVEFSRGVRREDLELDETKCRYCASTATKRVGGGNGVSFDVCPAHVKMAKGALRKMKAGPGVKVEVIATGETEAETSAFRMHLEVRGPEPVVGSWRILGIDDETDTCEQCGKTGLKRTVVLEPILDGGGIKRVGTTCASYLTKSRGSYVMKRGIEVQRKKDTTLEKSKRDQLISTLIDNRFWKQTKANLARYMTRSLKKQPIDQRNLDHSKLFLGRLLKDPNLKTADVKKYMLEWYDTTRHRPHFEAWWRMAIDKTEESASMCGAAGPAAGMTGSGNISTVAVPLGAGGWDGKKRRKHKKGSKTLSQDISNLLRRVW